MIDDTIFSRNNSTSSFPPIGTFSLQSTPGLTALGFETYLSRPEVREVLTNLTLLDTGVIPSELHRILATAPYLRSLRINQTINRALTPSSIPPLTSRSLQTFHFEIESPSTSPHDLQPPSESYYEYLASSILAGNFPSLDSLYALSTSLPTLLLPPPAAPFANAKAPTSGLRRPLKLYTKSIPEHDWYLTVITPPTSTNRRGSATATRPISFYNGSTQLGPQWGDKARDSVIVGNGFGGFLAVPNEDGTRPSSSAGGHKHKHSRSKSKNSAGWMG